VRTTDVNMTPLGDPFDALVYLAQPANVDTVVVDGRILRQNGRYAALDHAKVVHDALQSAAELRRRAAWP
jgi:5-methylthioadenosine/S-adenosylhomocysteine deaminase